MKFLAGVIDFFIVVIGFGYILTQFSSGGADGQQISVSGIWFLIWIIAGVAYFILCRKFLGQSLGKTILGIKKGQSK